MGRVRAGRRRKSGWIVTIHFRPKQRMPEEREEMAAAFKAWREWRRSQGSRVELVRLRNRFLDALGPEPLKTLRIDVAPAFTKLLAKLEGTDKEFAATGPLDVLDWPEAKELRRRLAAWANRWHLIEADSEDPWIRHVALRTLAHWHRTPDAPLAWRHRLPAHWFPFATPEVSHLANIVAREGREAGVKWIRARGHSRAYAREMLRVLQGRTTVVPRRRYRNAHLDAEDIEASEDRSVEWLAARCRGGTDVETARAAGMTRQAVTASNRRAAKMLGLAYRSRRGRPPRTPRRVK